LLFHAYQLKSAEGYGLCPIVKEGLHVLEILCWAHGLHHPEIRAVAENVADADIVLSE